MTVHTRPADLVYTLKPGELACIYGGRLIVTHPNQSPFYIDLATRERHEVELGDDARSLDWRSNIEGICK
jgi:hypothetical protein